MRACEANDEFIKGRLLILYRKIYEKRFKDMFLADLH